MSGMKKTVTKSLMTKKQKEKNLNLINHQMTRKKKNNKILQVLKSINLRKERVVIGMHITIYYIFIEILRKVKSKRLQLVIVKNSFRVKMNGEIIKLKDYK